MALLESALDNLAAYPRWFVAVCAIIVSAGVLWLLAKILKWTVYLAACLTLGVVVVGVLLWWLR